MDIIYIAHLHLVSGHDIYTVPVLLVQLVGTQTRNHHLKDPITLGSPTWFSSARVFLSGASDTNQTLLKIGMPFDPCLNAIVACSGFVSIVSETIISSGFLSLQSGGSVAGPGKNLLPVLNSSSI